MNHSPPGLVLLDKPSGVTSFKALTTLKVLLCSSKVGHTGTLDAFASGLLLALTGSLTKLAGLFVALDKTYEAVITFGSATDTLDPEGEITSRGEIPAADGILKALPGFRGEIEQTPPIFSAVHVGGQRAHRLARAGKVPVLKPRRVSIYELEVRAYEPPDLSLRIRCSKGTYIRSLARDLAAAAGSCGFVSRLRRTHTGPFSVDAAVAPDAFLPETHLLPAQSFLPKLPGIEILLLKEGADTHIRNGTPLRDGFIRRPPRRDGTYALLTPAGELIAVARREAERYRYQGVFSGSHS